jgi:hypothetical protein
VSSFTFKQQSVDERFFIHVHAHPFFNRFQFCFGLELLCLENDRISLPYIELRFKVIKTSSFPIISIVLTNRAIGSSRKQVISCFKLSAFAGSRRSRTERRVFLLDGSYFFPLNIKKLHKSFEYQMNHVTDILTAGECVAAHILIIVCVDGTIYGVSQKDGSILWSTRLPTSNMPADSVPIDNSVFIPDPIDGEVYHYDLDAKKLQKLSVSLKDLVNQPAFLSGDGKYQTSSMTSEVISINPLTGDFIDDDANLFERNQSIFITKTTYVMTILKGSLKNR